MATINHTCSCGARWTTKDSPSRCSDCGKQSYGAFVRDTAKPKKIRKDDEENDYTQVNPEFNENR